MLRRRTPAVEYCLKRAAEAEHLAALAQDLDTKTAYRKLAHAWRRLAQDPGFTERLDTTFSVKKDQQTSA